MLKHFLHTLIFAILILIPTNTSAYESVNFNYDNQQAGVLSSILNSLLPQSNAQTPDITTGLVGHWTFDGTAVDSSGNGNDGTLVNGPTWMAGKIGQALSFNGVDDYITLSNSNAIENKSAITISAWVKPGASDTGTMYIVDQLGVGADVGYMGRFSSERYRCLLRNDSQTEGSSITDGTFADTDWHHVVCVYDGATVQIYVDVINIDSTPGSLTGNTESTPGNNLFISSDTSANGWDGLIDDVRIYDRALTAADITELYNYPSTGSGQAQCEDTIDNDSDTLIDYPNDPGCTSTTDNDETDPVTCTSFTYSAWSPSTCPVSQTQTRTVATSLPSGCTGGTPTTSQSCTYTPDITKPSIPTNLQATTTSSSQINLTWTASTDNSGVVSGYNIYRNGVKITTSSNTSHPDTELTADTQYTYTVSAYDAVPNTSPQSNSVSATTEADTVGGGTFGPQSSNKNIEWGFDFVETFDGLQDWSGDTSGAGRRFTNLPKNSDGSISNWEWYVDSYVPTAPGENAIDSFGSNYVWGGTGKSARIDIKEGANGYPNYFSYGTNDFGINFANESAPNPEETGYDDLYLFHMVKIPKNEFPTGSYDDPTTTADDNRRLKSGEYVDGQDYIEVGSWKFGTFNMGTIAPQTTYGQVRAYSPYHVIPHLKSSTGDHTQVFMKIEANDDPEVRCEDLANATGRSGKWGTSKSINSWIKSGQWFGVEFHLRNTVESNVSVTYYDAWLYDETGNVWKVIDGYRKEYYCQPNTHKWNEFFFGGNNSAQYIWGPTMESPYYVDDFIIDDQRIGTKYFSFINDTTSPPTSADLNQDGMVNSLDWSIMNSAWGTNDPTADININPIDGTVGDGTVNALDWSVMNAQWS